MPVNLKRALWLDLSPITARFKPAPYFGARRVEIGLVLGYFTVAKNDGGKMTANCKREGL
jgi:hypothetical protein